MGNFYVNFTLRSDDKEALTERLKAANRQAYFHQDSKGMMVVYDRGCEEVDPRQSKRLASDISKTLACPVLAALNYDDDLLLLALYENAEATASYSSDPEMFEGEGGVMPAIKSPREFATVLCRAFEHADVDAVATILDADLEQYPFAVLRHEALASALGLPDSSVGLGYHYIEMGDLPPKMDQQTLVKVSSTSA